MIATIDDRVALIYRFARSRLRDMVNLALVGLDFLQFVIHFDLLGHVINSSLHFCNIRKY